MNVLTRREFLLTGLLPMALRWKLDRTVQTVSGPIRAAELGLSLIHEHILVDFIGADKTSSTRWNRDEVVRKALPFLLEAKAAGVKSFFDCTPAFLGRDVVLLKRLADETQLNIITNTGYYGAVQNKYLPPWAFTETAHQLSDRWVAEFEKGIDGTPIRPGFIKIGVDASVPLSALHRKLVQAAALVHLRTGLTICSHTGPGSAAFEEIEVLKENGVHPSAFVWVHAQAENDRSYFVRAARAGAWVSLDGVGWGNFDKYAETLAFLKGEGLLNHILLSHDAGWYKPDEPTAAFQNYLNIFTELKPRLMKEQFSNEDISQLLTTNPSVVFGIHTRKI